MGGWASLVVLALAGFTALYPLSLAWLYVGAVAAFEAWLFGVVRSAGGPPPRAGEPPYQFSDAEARLVGRYPFYFRFPGIARHASSVLAATGLSSLVLSPWLAFRTAYAPAVVVALNLLVVAWLTRRVVPQMALTLAANRGNREARDLLDAHETAWEKIRRCNIEAKEPAP